MARCADTSPARLQMMDASPMPLLKMPRNGLDASAGLVFRPAIRDSSPCFIFNAHAQKRKEKRNLDSCFIIPPLLPRASMLKGRRDAFIKRRRSFREIARASTEPHDQLSAYISA